MSIDCPHPDFTADVTVNRLEDVGGFAADVRIACSACNQPFAFIGAPTGLSPDHPTSSVDGTELRAPIRPSMSHTIPRYPGFTVRETRRSDA